MVSQCTKNKNCQRRFAKIIPLLKDNWKLLTPIALLGCCFGLLWGQISSVGMDNIGTLSGDTAETVTLPNTTFLKSYRLLVFTKINSAQQTKDGGYIVSGTTDPNIMMIPPDGFVAKLNKQGDVSWMRFLKSTNAGGVGNARGDEDVQSIIELKNGGYLMASKVWGFITTAESSSGMEINKILFTRLDKNGTPLWSRSFTGGAEDARNSLLETSDGGFIFHANITDIAPNLRGEDSTSYQDLPFASLKVMKLDLNGNLKWAKNVKNFLARANDSYFVATSDGGYAIAGDMTEVNPEKTLPYNFDTYPGLAKFDQDFNFQWAKTLESTAIDMGEAIAQEEGGYKMGWKKWRQPACVIRGMVRTQDNGYMILGSVAGLSMLSNSFDLNNGVKTWLVGFKFGATGNLEWAKKMTFGFNEFTSPLLNFSLTLTNDNGIMLAGPISWADENYRAKIKQAEDAKKLYCAKYQLTDEQCALNQILNTENSEQTKADWAKVEALFTTTQDAYRPGVFMMKMDDNLKVSWAKTINPQRGATNYVIKPTADNGAIIGGEYITNIVKSRMLSSITYYKDGFLMKLDASGNVKNSAWTVDYTSAVTTELITPYTVSNNLSADVAPFAVKPIKRVPEFSLYKKAKTSTYAAFNTSKTTLPPVAPPISAYDTPLLNTTSTSTVARTWPRINYEKAIPITEMANDRSRTLHAELLPILNQLYGNQVKLTDNLSGQMLSYIFDRVITQEDMTAIKNYLVSKGYKTQDEGTYILTIYKVGYFLNLTFTVGNQYSASMDVTY